MAQPKTADLIKSRIAARKAPARRVLLPETPAPFAHVGRGQSMPRSRFVIFIAASGILIGALLQLQSLFGWGLSPPPVNVQMMAEEAAQAEQAIEEHLSQPPVPPHPPPPPPEQNRAPVEENRADGGL